MIACPENADVCVFNTHSMSRIDSTVDKPKGRFRLDVDDLLSDRDFTISPMFWRVFQPPV